MYAEGCGRVNNTHRWEGGGTFISMIKTKRDRDGEMDAETGRRQIRMGGCNG